MKCLVKNHVDLKRLQNKSKNKRTTDSKRFDDIKHYKARRYLISNGLVAVPFDKGIRFKNIKNTILVTFDQNGLTYTAETKFCW